MATIGTLAAKVTADTSQFEAGMKRAGKAQSTFSQNVEKLGKTLTLLRGGAAVAGIVALTGALTRFNEKLGDIRNSIIRDEPLDKIVVSAARAVPVLGELGYQLSELKDTISGRAFQRDVFKAMSDSAAAARKSINDLTRATARTASGFSDVARNADLDVQRMLMPEAGREQFDIRRQLSDAIGRIRDQAAKERGELDKEASAIANLRKQEEGIVATLRKTTDSGRGGLATRRITEARVQRLAAIRNEITQRSDALTRNRIVLDSSEQQAIERTARRSATESIQSGIETVLRSLADFGKAVDESLKERADKMRENMEQIRRDHEYEAIQLDREYEQERDADELRRREAATSGPVARFASAMEANSAEAMRFMAASNTNSPESQTAKNTKRTADLINQLKAAWLASQGVVVRI